MACLLVMWHHIYIFGMPRAVSWAWVEYFFILSGFFTASHFYRKPIHDECGKEAVLYALRKFAPLFPYIVISVTARYILLALSLLPNGEFTAFASASLNYPFELLLLTSSGIASALLPPIWYLSALFIALPLFSWLIIKLRDSWPVWSVLIPVLYYGKMGVNVDRTPINDLLRAFVGLTLGSAVYYAVNWLKGVDWGRVWRFIFTIAEVFALILSVFITLWIKPHQGMLNLLVISFSVLAVLTLSQTTYSSRLCSNWCTFLAKISVPMYLFHWNVGMALSYMTINVGYKIALYYFVTFLISAAAVLIETNVRNRLKHIHLRPRVGSVNIKTG